MKHKITMTRGNQSTWIVVCTSNLPKVGYKAELNGDIGWVVSAITEIH